MTTQFGGEKMLKAITTLVASAALSVCFAANSALAAPLTVKFSHVVAENTPKGQMANKFKDLVNERLAGKVVVEVYPNSQLFGDNSEMKALLLGDIQFCAPALSKFAPYTKKLQIFDLPFLFKDMAAVDTFQSSDKGQELLDSLGKKGFVGLGYLHNGLKQFSSSKALKVPSDAHGLKFRIMSSDVLAAQFQAVMATPLKKPFSEVFTLLQTRAIDGQENTWSNIYSKKFFEVQPYITESNHGLLDYMVVTSKEFWMSVPEADRKILKGALDEAIAFGNEIAAKKAEGDKVKIIESNRSEVISLTDAERSQWVEVMKPVWEEFEKEIGKDMIDAAYKSNM